MATNKRMMKIDQCKICGETAFYSYFGVVVCQPCKMFFKRNAENNQKTFICVFDSRCQIKPETRHLCSACRLKKCFDCGMRVELIRHSLSSKIRKKRSTTNSNSSTDLLPTLNLVRNDTSLLTKDQWASLTNLINLYDLSRLFDLAQRLGPSSSNCDQKILKRLFSVFYEESGEACRKNVDYQTLSSSDRSVLLPTAIDNMTCLGGIFTCSQTQLIHHVGYMTYVDAIYGLCTINHHQWATTFVKCDEILFKLALALFALSTNSRTLQRNFQEEFFDVKTILQIENRYAELTWKYLLYRYTFQEAVERFVQLIRWFLAMSVFLYYAHCSRTHIDDLDSFVEDTEIKLIIDDINETKETKTDE